MERVKKPRRSKAPVRDEAADGGSGGLTDVTDVETEELEAAGDDQPQDSGQQELAPRFHQQGASAHAQDFGDDDDADMMPGQAPHVARNTAMSVHLSHQLHCKLVRTAHEEGVSLEALVQELLAEGVTLRAWEIIERKNTMRGGNQAQPPQPPGGNRNFNNSYGNNRHNNNNRGPTPGGNNPRNSPNNRNVNRGAPNNAWMEDKAAFLEYVRNQEKRRR